MRKKGGNHNKSRGPILQRLPGNGAKTLGGINARFTPTFKLSTWGDVRLREITQYMPEYDLEDFSNQNPGTNVERKSCGIRNKTFQENTLQINNLCKKMVQNFLINYKYSCDYESMK